MSALLLSIALGQPPSPTQADLDEWKRHLATTLSHTATTDQRIYAFQRLSWEGAYQMIPEIERLRAEIAALKKQCETKGPTK